MYDFNHQNPEVPLPSQTEDSPIPMTKAKNEYEKEKEKKMKVSAIDLIIDVVISGPMTNEIKILYKKN